MLFIEGKVDTESYIAIEPLSGQTALLQLMV